MSQTFAKRLLIMLSLLFMYCSMSLAQDEAKPFVRLATYWDAPGFVDSVSADDRWIVVYEPNSDTSRLVEVATGQILVTNARKNTIQFSLSGRFASINTGEKESTQIFDLSAKKLVADVPGVIARFSDDDSGVMVDESDRAAREYTSRVVDTLTGKVLLMVKGRGTDISLDAGLIVVEDTSRLTTSVYDTTSGKAVFEFATRDYQEGQQRNTTSYFSPDGRLLSIYQANKSVTYIIDTRTWEVVSDVSGFAIFSPDSRFVTTRGDDGPMANVRLIEARSGHLVDSVYGNMWFSKDGKLLYREEGSKCAYRGMVKVLDVATMQMLVDVQYCAGVELLADNALLHISSGEIDAAQYQEFFNMKSTWSTMNAFWQVHASDLELIDYPNHLVLLTHRGWESIESYTSDEVFAAERQITLSDSHKLAFASNGLLVDVYGAADLRVDSMPAPRQGGGIVQVAEGTMKVYPKPDAVNPVAETDRNPFTFYVMGKSADEQWLYVTYSVLGRENVRKEGWIANDDQLTVIEDWRDVPVLSGDDPMGEMRAEAK